MAELQQDLNVLMWAASILGVFAVGLILRHWRTLKRKQPRAGRLAHL
jgi:hypothetical protein